MQSTKLYIIIIIFLELINVHQLNAHSLSAYYNFDDGTATDQTSNNSHGTLFGSIETVNGITGNALKFDGNDWITFDGPINDALDTDNFTISFYFKADTLPDIHTSLFSSNINPLNHG